MKVKVENLRRSFIPNLDIKSKDIQEDKINNPEKLKRNLKRSIIITEKYKEEITNIVNELDEKLKLKKISQEEYNQDLSDALNTKSLEEWVDYYSQYIEHYQNEIEKCDILIEGKSPNIIKKGKRKVGLFEKLFGKKEVKKEENNLEIDALKAIKRLKAKKFDSKSIQILNQLLRVFLKEKYGLRRSLTVQEIKNTKTFRKIKRSKSSKILEILETIQLKEYGKTPITLEEFEKLLMDTEISINNV